MRRSKEKDREFMIDAICGAAIIVFIWGTFLIFGIAALRALLGI